jgi:hypothetical protein
MTVVEADPEEPAGTGRFNTTPSGAKWIEFRDNLTVDFPVPVNAFGFFGTDFGDFNGQVSVTFTDAADIESTFNIPHTIPAPNATLIFWGFVNPANTYKRMRLFCTYVVTPPEAQQDFFGVDDVIIGTANP